MARRRSLTRRWSRRSINGSAVLNQDSNYIDEEDDTYWRHLPNQTRYSNTSVNVSSKVFLNSNSRIIDDDDIEATEWWNHLQKTSQDLVVPIATTRTEVSNSDNTANVSNATSHSDAHSITEAIKKKRVMLGAKRKSSGKNPFSQALDSSDIAVESEPISSLKRKDTFQNLSRSVEEEVRQSKRSRISTKSNLKNSPDSNTSTDTEKISKARPLLFRRPKRKSSYAFDKILLEDDSIVGPSQPSNANKNKTLDDGNKIQENNEDTNKTKEFMTQPRSPFDKLRRSPRKSKSTIITESQENEEISQNKDQRSINTTVESTDHNKIYNSIDNIEKTKEIITKMQSSAGKIKRATQKSIDNSMNVGIMDTSIKSRGRNSHKRSSDSDKNFQLQVSDGSISKDDSSEKVNNETDSPLKIDDRSSPLRSRPIFQIASLSSSESEVIETRKSKRINDDLSNQNSIKSIENIRNESKPQKSRSKLLSINQQLNAQREKSSIVNPENETHQENLSENTSSTESLFEVQKSGYQSSGAQQEQLNSQRLLHQDELVNRESEREMESEVVEYNEGSDNMSAKSIQELATEENQINDKSKQQSRVMTSNRSSIETKRKLKRQLSEVSQHGEEDEKESRLKKKKSISHKKSRGSSKQRMIENSLSNDIKESSFEKRRISNNKSSVSLKQRITQEIPPVREDEEQSESEEDTQNNNAEKTSKSIKKRRTQLNSSIDKDREDEIEKSQKSLRSGRTKKISLSNRNEEQSESEEENDEAEKSQKSLRSRRTKEISLSHRNEEQSESEEENDEAEKSQKSLRSRRTKEISLSHRDEEQSESDEENDEAEKSQKSLRNRRTKEISLSHRDDEQSESEGDTQNNNAEKTSKSFKTRRTQLNSSIDEDRKNETKKSQKSLKNRQTQQNLLIDEDESESEPTKEKENITEEIQESIKQRKLSSMASISRKLFLENLEDKSSIITESSKRSRESSRSNIIIDPSAYELPNRTRSDSYSESDTDDVHKNPVIINDEPMQSMTDNNLNLPGPSTSAQTPLPSSLTNQRSKLLKRSEPLKMNTLDRYLLNKLASNHPRHIGRSEDDLLPQEQLQELGDKLKKIKEKTDKITEKEVKQVQERTAKLQNSSGTRSTVRNNLGNLKNKNKTPKSVNKAYIVNGQVYKQPKLPRPQKWATNRLYKYLWKKMEPKYNLDTRIKSEQFVTYLSDVVKVIKRRKKFVSYEEDLNELIKKMAQLGIIKTRMDFYNFCYDFLPYEFRVKVTPMLMPGNVRNIPFDPDTLTAPIINKQ